MATTTRIPRKVAIVTGSAGGIGKSIALRLIKDGPNIVLCDLSQQKDNLAEVVKEAEKIRKDEDCQCVAVTCDVSQEDQVQAMVDRTVDLFGRLDCMVANAGILALHSLADVPLETFRKIMDVNVIGTLICFRVAAAAMIKCNSALGGRLIAACSAAGKQGYNFHGAYCASKFAIRALVHTAAMEYAPVGINVNAYAPGVIDTPLTQTYVNDLGPSVTGLTSEQFLRMGIDKCLMKRVGQTEEIANLASFFASEESSFMTGQMVSIDGGAIFE